MVTNGTRARRTRTSIHADSPLESTPSQCARYQSGLALSKTTTLRSESASIRPTSSANSATVVPVIVLVGAWSKVTRQ